LQLVVHFHDSAVANLAIQLLTGIGVPGDRLGVLPPEKVAGGRGMILVAGCPTAAIFAKAEAACRTLGGRPRGHRSYTQSTNRTKEQRAITTCLTTAFALPWPC